MNKQLGRDVFEDYKLYLEHGRTLEHSVRVYPVKRSSEDNRRVLEWKLWEYSTLYGWGANSETPLIDLKSQDEINIAELMSDLELMISKGNYSDERGRQIETKYAELKSLLDSLDTQKDPLDTRETDPSGTHSDPSNTQKDSGILSFINQIKI